jgi:broad specificity phosphatase PhoE
MPNRLILIRHAQPRVDSKTASVEWALCDSGRTAAVALSLRLGRFAFRRIFSNPEAKAIGTAEAIATAFDLPVRVEHDLREHERRTVGFLSRDAFEAGVADFFRFPDARVFGDETATEAFRRFDRLLIRLRREEEDADIVAVTHGTVLSLYASRICRLDALAFWRGLTMPAAVLIEDDRLTPILPDGLKRAEQE